MSRVVFFLLGVLALNCTQLQGCPAPAGGPCAPRKSVCPGGYHCALAEVCTRECSVDTDCHVSSAGGCYSNQVIGMTLPDGGMFIDTPPEDGICPDTKAMVCLDGFCQRPQCLDGGCDYDVYGPSPFKGAQ